LGSDRSIKFGRMLLTQLDCRPGSLGVTFVDGLMRVSSFLPKDDELYLELPVDSGSFRFRRRWFSPPFSALRSATGRPS
jgi:hypothetical protein